jgi:iron-sulfur cluster assembly protein
MIEKYDPNDEKLLDITPAAKAHFLGCLQHNNAIGIYLGVQKTGCSGLSYVTQVINIIPNESYFLIELEGISFYMQESAVPYLKGLVLDYTKQNMGLSSLVYHNPNESARCGCGESFTITELGEDD